MSSDQNRSEILANFQAITEKTPEESIKILERLNWNLEHAVTWALNSNSELDNDNLGSVPPTPETRSNTYRRGAGTASPRSSAMATTSTTTTTTTTTTTSTPSTSGSSMGKAILSLFWKYGFGFFFWIFSFGFKFLRSLIPFGDDETPMQAARRLLLNFEDTYGTAHPHFFEGSYNQALNRAKTEFKFLLIYLHSPSHKNTAAFCRETLTSPAVTEFINSNFVLWVGDVTTSEGYVVSNAVAASTYPYLGVICTVDGQSALLTHVEGHVPVDNLIGWLVAIQETHGPLLATARAQREEVDFNRVLREEQDRAFQESLAADQEKERKAREEEIRKMQIEKEKEEEAKRQEEAAREEEERRTREIEKKRRRLPTEPGEKDADITKIFIRLPSGARIGRRFKVSDPLQVVYDFVDLNQSEVPSEKYNLVSTYPVQVYDHLQADLKTLTLFPNVLLTTQEKD